MMDPAKLLFYEFDEFRVDIERRLLFRNGRQVSLTPKVFDLLLVLIESRSEVLEKDRLMQLLWSDSFVEESNIVQNVAVLRRALGERSKENRFIVTVPGRGYRFIAEVRSGNARTASETRQSTDQQKVSLTGNVLKLVLPTATGSAVALAAEEHADPSIKVDSPLEDAALVKFPPARDPARPRHFSSYSIAVVTGLLAIGAIAAYLVIGYMRRAPSVGGDITKIAVLPPRPVDVGKRERGLEFAIAHSFILKLGESKSFNVSQLSAVRKFVELDEDPIKAGRELGVDFVLATDYQLSDGRVRVASRLLNVSSGVVEQSFKTEAPTSNAFKMQDAIANEIGNGVLARFGRPATNFAARHGTSNDKAQNLFYEALYLVDKNTLDDSAKAADLLGQALILDPAYAQAWALRAQAYCQFGHRGGGVPEQVFTIAGPMLDKALALDSENATAYMVRGLLNRDYHWQVEEAYRDIKRSIEIDPNICQAHRVLGSFYYRDEQFSEALEEQRKALEINPTSVQDRWILGFYLIAAGQRDDGVAQLKRVIELDPSLALTYDTLWQLYHREGDHANAYKNFLKLKEIYGTKPEALAKLRNAYTRSGWPGVLRADLEQTRSQDPKGGYSGRKYYIAALAALTGDKDLAFEYLEEALRYRHVFISYLKVDRRFDNLRDDPRFNDVLRRSGLAPADRTD